MHNSIKAKTNNHTTTIQKQIVST